MSNEFEWQTEDEVGWVEEMAAPPIRPSRRFPWKLLVLVLVGVLVIVAGGRWQVNRQVNAAAAHVENEVRAAHRFLYQVAARRDEDLFKSLMSGRDLQWSGVQQSLVARGWFGNPPLLAGTAVPLTTSDPFTITLSPDFFTAEVQSEQSYHLLNPQGITETVTLRQTAVYRKGESRWLYAPLEDEFWGETDHYIGRYIFVSYPARDKEVIFRLAQDLDTLMAAICKEITSCFRYSNSSRLQLQFHKEASSLMQSANLPTPSLIGLPVDEAGYQALFRVYGAHVAVDVITAEANYECCRWQLLHQALLDRQLYHLGLQPWPLNPAMYEQLVAQSNVGEISRLLFSRLDDTLVETQYPDEPLVESEIQQAQLWLYVLVEFMESIVAPDVTLAEMQATLSETHSMTVWVNRLAADRLADKAIHTALFQYVLRQHTASQQPPPIPLPAATQIRLICSQNDGALAFHEYDLATDRWRYRVFETAPPAGVNIQLIGPDMVLLGQYPGLQRSTIAYTLLEDGQPLASFTLDDGPGSLFVQQSDPRGRYLLLGRIISPNEREFRLLDFAACRQGACQPEPVDGLMTWSPDGRHTLITLSKDLTPPVPAPIWLGDEAGANRQVVGVGQFPFWLDDYTYGYQRQGEWVTAVITDNIPFALFTVDDLLAQIPPAEHHESLGLALFTLRDVPDQLYIRASSSGSTWPRYLFRVTLPSVQSPMKSVTLLHHSSDGAWFNISPDGRWLIPQDLGTPEVRQPLLMNLETGEQYLLPDIATYSSHVAWSPDGRWYARMGDGVLAVGAPDARYERYIFHKSGNCSQVYWGE